MSNKQSLQLSRNHWEHFANEDPCHYICTELPRNDAKSFWQSGEDTARREILPLVERYKLKSGIAMEFGCGVGRLLFPLANHFQTVVGLDIAPTMVSKAASIAAQRQVRNTNFVAVEDPDQVVDQLKEYQGRVDVAYSLLVFQHIDDFTIIAAYLKAISQLLSPEGIGYLQFDTRPQGALYHIKMLVPDTLLLRQWRRGIRRIRREPAQLESCFTQNSLLVLDSIAEGTEHHRFVVRRKY